MFQAIQGVKVNLLDADSTAKKILDTFLMPELWDTMGWETNQHVEQMLFTPSSHMKAWEGTTAEELQMLSASPCLWACCHDPICSITGQETL